MKPVASLIILTYNNLEYTRLCLESIERHTGSVPYEIILVDNASRDDTPQFLKGYSQAHTNVKIILNNTNLGFAKGNNQGAAVAEGECLVFLNNDIVVTTGWLPKLLQYLDDPSVGMVGPATNSSANETRIQADYDDLEEMERFAEAYTLDHTGQAFEIDMLPLQCAALRRAVFAEIGPLDERFGIGMFEDDDYALRLRQAGYRILCAEDVFVHHWGSASFSKLPRSGYWELFHENLAKFEDKWGRRWIPHKPRSEFLPERLRGDLDSILWLNDVIADREYNNRLLEEQLAAKSAELRWIYESNGWAFLQSLLRIRRKLVPEGSRQERLFRLGLQTLRDFKPRRIAAVAHEARNLLKSQAPTIPALGSGASRLSIQGALRQAQGGADDAQGTVDRFPWPLVSVILPVYNQADMLEGAAHSVLYGSYPFVELIILDDGSTDEIEPLLQRLALTPRVRVYRQPNQKLPRALTHAHAFARGDFITWTSSDNLLAPTALEELVRTLLEHPQAVLAYADVTLINAEGKPLRDEGHRPQNQDPDRVDILRLYRDARPLGYEADNYISACFLYRRSAAQALEGRFSDDLRGLEDYDFWLRLQKAGPFRHVGNREPLYFYRVHRRTMSHELLSQGEENAAHVQRIERLLAYEGERRAYSQKRWTLALEDALPPDLKARLCAVAGRLAVDIHSYAPAGAKTLRVIAGPALEGERLTASLKGDFWQLSWRVPGSEGWRSLELWAGIEIHPQATKARQHRRNIWEFPQAGERPILGVHWGLANLPFDIPLARQVIEQNRDVFFVFADTKEGASPERGRQLTAGQENAVYLEARPFGEAYSLYACLDAFWLPPTTGASTSPSTSSGQAPSTSSGQAPSTSSGQAPSTASSTSLRMQHRARLSAPEHAYRSLLALAYATGRPFLSEYGFPTIPAPYQSYFYPPDDALAFVGELDRAMIDPDLLDTYLQEWTPAGALAQLLRYADAATQEVFLERPDFGIQPLPEAVAQPWHPAPAEQELRAEISVDRTPVKCALVVNSLDKGGLEELVGQFARRLYEYGAETFILCVEKGGAIANGLQEQGVRVYVADGDAHLMRQILQREKPRVVNSHWAHLDALQAASGLGIPVVETIHSSYIWLDEEAWQNERRRSRFFTHALATSENTRRYYLKWNNTVDPEWVSVVPTGIDTQRLELVDRSAARQSLGLAGEDFLFLCLASYDGAKNQLGILSAFGELARQQPQARLLCAGGVANPDYYSRLCAYRERLKVKDRIELHEFRKDIGLLLSAADAFVLNSFSEGWSLAATEALVAGLPLIHSDCGSAWELVGRQGERGIVTPNPVSAPINITRDQIAAMFPQERQRNTEALVAAMDRLVNERERWRALHPDIRSFALENFKIENTLEEYVRVFRKLAVSSL